MKEALASKLIWALAGMVLGAGLISGAVTWKMQDVTCTRTVYVTPEEWRKLERARNRELGIEEVI